MSRGLGVTERAILATIAESAACYAGRRQGRA